MPISKIKTSSILADAASTNLNIDAGTLFLDATNNRVGIGTTSPTSNLTVAGNTTLGDAATDTVQVNGYMGVGGAANIANALTVGSPTLSGTTQRGIDAATTFGTGATASVQQIRAISTLTAAGVYAEWIGLNVPQPQGAGYTLTNAYGLYISDQTKGTNNYGITSLVSSGANKWNIYASGTADNYFAGDVLVGATSARTVFSGTITPITQVESTTSNAGISITRNALSAANPALILAKSRGTTLGSVTAVVANDYLGEVNFQGADGTNMVQSAAVLAQAEGTISTGVVPSRLLLSTANSSGTLTERMRIDSSGNVGIGATSPATKLEVAGSNNSTWTVTASVSGTTMTVTAVTGGTIAVGDLVFGANIQAYTRVTALGTGTGGVGTYTVSVSQTSASGSVSGAAVYANTLIRITDTDTSVSTASIGQPNGALQFYTSDASSPTAGVGAYVAALAESTTPDTALIFGTRDNGGGGVDANERMRLDSAGNLGIGTTAPETKLHIKSASTSLYSTVIAANKSLTGFGTVNYTATDISTDGTFAASQWLVTRNSGVEQYAYMGAVANSAGFSPDIVFGQRTASTVMTERMRIDSSGNLLIGTTSNASSQGAKLQVDTSIAARRNIANVGGPAIRLEKSRATSDGSYTIVANGDTLGEYQFFGADGVQHIIGARVKAVVDGTPGVNDMPSALTFDTTADGAAATTERMRITSAGRMGIGVSSPSVNLEVLNSFKVISTSATLPTIVSQSLNPAGYTPPQLQLYRVASNGITPDSQTIGEIRFDGGNTAAGYDNMGMIYVTSGTNTSAGAPSTMSFSVATSGATASERVRIDSTGALGVSHNAPFQWGVSTGVGAELSVQSSNTTHAGVTVQAGLSRYWIGTPYNSNVLEIGGNGGGWPGDVTNANGAKITINPNGVTSIKFEPSQVASANANTLDDYEEGSWTPNVSGASVGSFSAKSGTYVKIGKQVTIWFRCDSGNTGAGGATQYVSGLPFTVGNYAENSTVGVMGTNGPSIRMQSLMALTANRAVLYVYNGGSQEATAISFASGTATYWVD